MSINTKQSCKHKNIDEGSIHVFSCVLYLDKNGYTLPSPVECLDCKNFVDYETYSKYRGN